MFLPRCFQSRLLRICCMLERGNRVTLSLPVLLPREVIFEGGKMDLSAIGTDVNKEVSQQDPTSLDASYVIVKCDFSTRNYISIRKIILP